MEVGSGMSPRSRKTEVSVTELCTGSADPGALAWANLHPCAPAITLLNTYFQFWELSCTNGDRSACLAGGGALSVVAEGRQTVLVIACQISSWP